MVCVALTRVGVMDGAVLYSNIFSTGTQDLMLLICNGSVRDLFVYSTAAAVLYCTVFLV